MMEPAGGSRTPSVLSDRVPHHSSGLAVPKRDSRATEHQPGNGPGRGVSALTVLFGAGTCPEGALPTPGTTGELWG